MAKDYFSQQSHSYLKYRPTYPPELFQYLSKHLKPGELVWDCATGNGQAAMCFDERFNVIATDQSMKQLKNRSPSTGVEFFQALAERAPIKDKSVSLITIAQALHWFNFEQFYREVSRVLKPGGMIAAWTYSFLSASPQLGSMIDECVRRFYYDVIGPYWPEERRWVDEFYASIPFPFHQVEAPSFYICLSWDLEDLIGYISSWSAVSEYKKIIGADPVPQLIEELRIVWGHPKVRRDMRWRLGLRVGRQLA